jgi:hypothetical protein
LSAANLESLGVRAGEGMRTRDVLLIRSDNGPEFTAREICRWLARIGVMTLFIERGSF